MNYTNRLKGAVTQVLLKSLLEDAGYRIVPLGIEAVLREVASLPKEDYLKLGLPIQLRKLPDFFVSNNAIDKTWLVEVKYRKSWNDEVKKSLGAEIREQVKTWNPLFLMIFLGHSADDPNSSPIYHMRIAKLIWDEKEGVLPQRADGKTCIWENSQWKHFLRVQDVFSERATKSKWEEQTIEKTKELAIKLKELDFFG
jgi:hypothetical protein